MSVFGNGDLSEETWTGPIKPSTTDEASIVVSFKMPNTADITPAPTAWKLTGADSIVGRGVQISNTGGILARGVIGVSNDKAHSHADDVKTASCQLQPIANAPFKVNGQVYIRQAESRTGIRARIEGLQNNAMYGFHIHKLGDLGSNDGMSTGGHYNPADVSHKLPGGAQPGHVGDLGNIAYYDNVNVAWYDEQNISAVRLTDANANVLGRAIVVHSLMDNGCEQPTGGAGARLAFCVIGVSPKSSLPSMGMPFPTLPAQKGSTGCSLENTPTNSPRSASFVWVAVVICVALAGIGAMFGYNWWRAKNNPVSNAANGRQPWYAHQNDDDDGSA